MSSVIGLFWELYASPQLKVVSNCNNFSTSLLLQILSYLKSYLCVFKMIVYCTGSGQYINHNNKKPFYVDLVQVILIYFLFQSSHRVYEEDIIIITLTLQIRKLRLKRSRNLPIITLGKLVEPIITFNKFKPRQSYCRVETLPNL